jgi:hypothetical protein
VVGKCDSHYPSYPTISAAVAAAQPNAKILVCPGVYSEGAMITESLTITAANPFLPPVVKASISVDGSISDDDITVNLSDLIVDGSGSTGGTGISYFSANGQLSRLIVKGWAYGMDVDGGDFTSNSISIQTSLVLGFTNTGINVRSPAAAGFSVNIEFSAVVSTNAVAQSGIAMIFADGTVAYNSIAMNGGVGLSLALSNFGVVAKGNSILGASTGIALSGIGGPQTVLSNYITNSIAQGIDAGCAEAASIERNTIVDSPVGIANISSSDTVTGNRFINVQSDETPCQ